MSASTSDTKKPAAKKETAAQARKRIAEALRGIAAHIVTLNVNLSKADAKVTSLKIQIGRDLLKAKPYFTSEDSGFDRDAFQNWATDTCKLQQSSIYDYMQAAAFLMAHPTAAPIITAVESAIQLDRFTKRAPDKLADVLGAAPKGATTKQLKAIMESVAPKAQANPTVTKEKAAKELQDLKTKVRSKVEAAFRRLEDEQQLVAIQHMAALAAKWGDEHGPLMAKAIQEISAAYNKANEEAGKELA
jgi:hypothetical protein